MFALRDCPTMSEIAQKASQGDSGPEQQPAGRRHQRPIGEARNDQNTKRIPVLKTARMIGTTDAETSIPCKGEQDFRVRQSVQLPQSVPYGNAAIIRDYGDQHQDRCKHGHDAEPPASVIFRPGIQSLSQDAHMGRFDILLA